MTRMWTVPATVIKVIDGDTIKLELDLGWRVKLTANCRIIGINAPEMNVAPGVRAKEYAQTLVQPGDEVTFLSHQLDKYGRPLGNVISDGLDFGEDMIEAGHAIRYDGG